MTDKDEFVASSLPGFQEDDEGDQSKEVAKQGWVLKKLNPMHLQVCTLLGQGMKQIDVARIAGCTPVYVSMLFRQPLIQQEIARMSAAAQLKLEASYGMVVETVIDQVKNGAPADKIKAARLMAELTKKIGRPDPFARGEEVSDEERLTKMALKLESLAKGARNGTQTIIDAEYTEIRSSQGDTVQGEGS